MLTAADSAALMGGGPLPPLRKRDGAQRQTKNLVHRDGGFAAASGRGPRLARAELACAPSGIESALRDATLLRRIEFFPRVLDLLDGRELDIGEVVAQLLGS